MRKIFKSIKINQGIGRKTYKFEKSSRKCELIASYRTKSCKRSIAWSGMQKKEKSTSKEVNKDMG